MLILGKLMVCACLAGSISHARKVSSTKRQRITYEYSYDCRVVCKSLFCFLHVIGEKVLKNLQSKKMDQLLGFMVTREDCHLMPSLSKLLRILLILF